MGNPAMTAPSQGSPNVAMQYEHSASDARNITMGSNRASWGSMALFPTPPSRESTPPTAWILRIPGNSISWILFLLDSSMFVSFGSYGLPMKVNTRTQQFVSPKIPKSETHNKTKIRTSPKPNRCKSQLASLKVTRSIFQVLVFRL